MSIQHSPGPLRYSEKTCNIYDGVGHKIANAMDCVMASQVSDDQCRANAKRIVDAWNACDGMADPAAEIAALRQQRNELLEALQRLCASQSYCRGGEWDAGRAAIAKAIR